MWFTETPWPPIYILFSLFILFFIYGVSTGRGRAAMIGLGCLLGCPLIYFLESAITTESEVVEQVVRDLAEDVEADRQQAVLDMLSDNVAEVRQLVATGMSRFDVDEDLTITDLSVEMLEEGQLAKAHFRANGTVNMKSSSGMRGKRFPSRWHVYFERDGNDWKVTKFERLNPISGETMPIFAASVVD